MPVVPQTTLASMFFRRLLLVGGAIVVGLLVLGVQTLRLTVVKGQGLRDEAERRTLSMRWTPTVRGRILDRKGRVLGVDRPAFDVMVAYDAITGDWAYNAAASRARREHRDEWGEMGRADRERLIEGYLGEYTRDLDSMWSRLAVALGVDRDELEDRRRAITAEVERMANSVWDARLEARRAELSRDRELLVEVSLDEVAQPIREQRVPHAMARGVGEETAFAVRRLGERYEGLSLEPGGRRTYPFESVTVEVDRSTLPPPLRTDGFESMTVHGVATHILGWMRPIYAEDVAARPRENPETGAIDRGHYQAEDRAGRGGIEESYEATLRGLRGHVVRHRDTGEEEMVEPTSGTDVRLTIDVMLQARVQAAMEPSLGLTRIQEWHKVKDARTGEYVYPMAPGTPLHGAAVVLDIATGDVLAMVSMPTFTREDVEARTDWVFADPVDYPYVNRAIARPYAPGSPIKPLMLAAAVTEGVHRVGEPISCTGHYLPEKRDRLRCWIYKQYGTTHDDQLGHGVYADDAICVSCNIYFYELGARLGIGGLKTWLGRFGVGRGFGLGIGDEYPGVVAEKSSGERVYKGDAIMMGIGQGPVSWTPLHAADAYATLVRGGQRIVPRIVQGQTPVAEDLLLDPEAVDAALEGLRRALGDEMGTGYAITYPSGERERIADIEGVSVWGKTGTATSSPIVGEDPDGEGPAPAPVLRRGDHAWFVLLAGREGAMPRYAVSVVMEYAGSGGRVSGPIAAQIVRALKAEGYL